MCGGGHQKAMSSPATSVTSLGTCRRTIVACFVFRREISHKAVWDFFDSIGQTRKCPCLHGTSVVPSRADVATKPRQVRFVPETEVAACSITSSASASSDGGTSTPSAFAALWLRLSTLAGSLDRICRPISCRAGLRPSGRGGGGISRGSIVRPGAALSRPGTAAGYRAEQPPGDIEAPRAAAAPLASLRP